MNEEPRKRSPFLTMLYFLVGLGAVLLLIGGIGLYMFLRTEEGQRILKLARQGSMLLAEAATAPGTDELRGIGCETALASPAGKIAELFRQIDPEGESGEVGEGFLSAGGLAAETPVVFCSQKPGQAGTPDCSSAARIYASALDPQPERFVVLMAPRRGDLAGCSGIYAPDGTRLADLPEAPPEAAPAARPDEAAPAGAGAS